MSDVLVCRLPLLIALSATAMSCASPVKPVPKLTASATDAERRYVLSKYRLEPMDDETMRRDTEMLELDQVKSLTADCPTADALVETQPLWPYVVAGVGGAALATGVSLELIRGNDAQPEDTDVHLGLTIAGASLLAIGIVADLVFRPNPPDLEAVAKAYNECLRAEVDRNKPPGVSPPADVLQPPPAEPEAPLLKLTVTATGAEVTETSTAAQ